MINRELAEKMMEGIIECNELLVQVVHELRSLPDRELAQSVRLKIDNAMAIHLTNIMNPIGDEYPDLYPEELRPHGGQSQ